MSSRPKKRGDGGKASWRLREGDEIAPGRWVVKRLGGGIRFEVYLAWEDRLFSLVVVKVLRPDRAESERSVAAMVREAELLDRLAHPVLLRGFGVVAEGPRPHLVLEHLEGATLRTILRHGPLTVEQLAPTAVQLAGALHYLATEEVVHLDLKPDNVVMGMPPRVIDLSLARSTADAARIRTPVGTRSYMAPEQCEPGARGGVGSPADVWGLGATLYHAASGERPFPRASERRPAGDEDRGEASSADRYPQLDREPAPLPSHVPASLAGPILGCLRPDPAERPSAHRLAEELEPLAAGVARRMVVGKRGPYWR